MYTTREGYLKVVRRSGLKGNVRRVARRDKRVTQLSMWLCLWNAGWFISHVSCHESLVMRDSVLKPLVRPTIGTAGISLWLTGAIRKVMCPCNVSNTLVLAGATCWFPGHKTYHYWRVCSNVVLWPREGSASDENFMTVYPFSWDWRCIPEDTEG